MGAGLRVAGRDGIERNLNVVNTNVYAGMSKSQIMKDLLSRTDQRAVIFDSNGNVAYVFDGHGGRNPGVTISEEALNVPNGEIVYSHVGSEAFGGTASPSAINHLVNSNLKTMTVVANEGNYTFTKTRNDMSEAKRYVTTLRTLMKTKNRSVKDSKTGKTYSNLTIYGQMLHNQMNKLNGKFSGRELYSEARKAAVKQMGTWYSNKLKGKGIKVTTSKAKS